MVNLVWLGVVHDRETIDLIMNNLIVTGDPNFIPALAQAVKSHAALGMENSKYWSFEELVNLADWVTRASKELAGEELTVSIVDDKGLGDHTPRTTLLQVTGIPPVLGLDLSSSQGFKVNEWDRLPLKLSNRLGYPLAAVSVKQVRGPVEVKGPMPELAEIQPKGTADYSVDIRPLEPGRQVPLQLDVVFRQWVCEHGGFQWEETLAFYIPVAAAHEDKVPISQTVVVHGAYYGGPVDQSQTTVGGDMLQQDASKTGDVLDRGATKMGEGVVMNRGTSEDTQPRAFKWCPHCGKELDIAKQARFCPHCGRSLEG